jgi:hypothetical protein
VIGRERDQVAVGCPSCGHIEGARESFAGEGSQSPGLGKIVIDSDKKDSRS